MSSSFSIECSQFSAAKATDELREEIRSQTGSDEAVASILRCIERFGQDPSIEGYEVTPTTKQRTYGGARLVAWSVRAVRPEPVMETVEA
jgi:hypothetical protein